MSISIKNFIFFLFIIFSQISCSFKLDNSSSEKKVSISLDFLDSAIRLNSNPTLQSIVAPTTTADFQCFLAKVTGPGIFEGAGVQGKSCTIAEGVISGQISSFFKRGESVKFQIPEKSNATVEIYGVYPSPAECGGTSTAVNGYILGSRSLTVNDNQALTIPVSFNSAIPRQFLCIPNNINLADGNIFGTGTDGDIVVSASITTPEVTTISNGRVFSANFKVQAILPDNKTLVLPASPTPAELTVGDEVLVHSTAASSYSDCDSAVRFGPGNYGFFKIQSISANQVVLANPIDVGTVFINTNLSTAPSFPTPFCSIQIRRVPQFNNLTVNASILVNTFSYANGNGGILPIRVKNILSGTSSISASGKGHNLSSVGNSGSGGSFPERSGFTGSNGAGGGWGNASTIGAGGGGGGGFQGGSGGMGANTGGQGGIPGFCSTADCLFLGGTGGAVSASAKSSGGVLMVFAKEVQGAIQLTADGGGLGATGDAGPGAGGVNVQTQAWTSSGGISASGSSGTSATAQGGGGGGGSVKFIACEGSLPTITVNGGTSGGGSAVAGQIGNIVTNINQNAPMCFVGL